MRIIINFQIKDSSTYNFKTLEMLTIPSLFIIETCLFKKFECSNNFKTSKTFRNYEDLKIKQRRLNVFYKFTSRNRIKTN